MKFLCDICKAKYQISDEKVSGKTVRMKCRRCGHLIEISAAQVDAATDGGSARGPADELPGSAAHAEGELLESLPEAGKPALSAPRIHDEVTDEPTAVLPPERGPIPAAAASQPFALTTPRTASSPSLRAVSSPRPLSSPTAPSAPRPLGLVPRAPGASAAPATPRAPLGGPATPRPLTSARPLGLPTSPRPAPTSAAAARPVGSSLHVPPRAPEATPAPPAMEGALQRSVTEEPAPLAHPTSTSTENWYVGVSGVPLGPIRLAVIREKAASGAVTGESLVWREGLDEWLPLRHFPELLELVEEARAAAAKPAHTLATPVPTAPPPASLGTAPPPALAPHRLQAPPAPPALTPPSAPAPIVEPRAFSPTTIPSPAGPGPAPASAASLAAEPAASDSSPAAAVLGAAPFDGPGAGSAAPLAAAPTLAPPAPPAPAVGPPEAPLRPAPLAASPVAAPGALEASAAPPPERRRAAMHPAAYAFIAMAAAFGGVAAFVLLSPAPPAPAGPTAAVTTQAAPTPYDPGAAAVPPPPPVETGAAEPAAGATAAPVAPIAGAGGAPKTGSAGAASPDKGTPAAPIDTSGFGSPGGVAGPSASPDGAGSGPAGLPSTLTAGEIQGVVSANQAGIRRKCWEPALDAAGASGKKSAKVTANVTIAPSGSVSAVSASGGNEFPGLASCIQTRIKGWKFPVAGGESRTAIPFVFASQ